MGRGLHLTIDEWFYHWFADEEKLPLAFDLFSKMFTVCDVLVMQKGNRHAHKFFELASASSMYPPKQREVVKVLIKLFLQNSNKVFWVETMPAIAPAIEVLLPRKDVYLVQICLASTDRIFVTSDTTLYQNLIDTYPQLNIHVYMMEEFMNSILTSYNIKNPR